MASGGQWQPQREQLQQLAQVLSESISPDDAARKKAEIVSA